jgi:hypothetical protein
MAPAKVFFDREWISFTSVLEEKPKLRHSLYRKLLTKHLRLPFVKYALQGEGGLVLLAHVPKERHQSARLPEVQQYLTKGRLWYQSIGAASSLAGAAKGKQVKSNGKRVPISVLRTAAEILTSTCENNGWLLSRKESRSYLVSFSEKNINQNEQIEVRFVGECVNFTVNLFNIDHTPRHVLQALSLWMMRTNSVLYYTKAGLSRAGAVFQVRIPVQDLSALECREAISALRAAYSGLSLEAWALLHPEVAAAYLEETMLDFSL